MDKLLQSDNATIEHTEIDSNVEQRKSFINAIANFKEPLASELWDILERYPYPCEERAALVTDVINRSYAKIDYANASLESITRDRIEDVEIEGLDEGSKNMLIDAIENHEEPYISELKAIFKKYPNLCEEQQRLIQDAVNRSYRKL